MARPPLTYRTHLGKDLEPYIGDVAEFRIRGFRAFPYLYEGTPAYERGYLEGYLTEPRAMLIRALDGDRPVGVATAVPLASSSAIVAEGPGLFRAAGLDPAEFYYYAEILVDPEYRGRGIAKAIYAERERLAREWGYSRLCLAVVQRAPDDPRRPPDYQPPERIWIRDGFVKTGISFTYHWPTIQPDGSVKDIDNQMTFWTKNL